MVKSSRDSALEKAFAVAELFEEPYFTAIQAVFRELEKSTPNMTTAKSAFDNAVKNAKVNPTRRKWLWNYLQHYDISNKDADTGW